MTLGWELHAEPTWLLFIIALSFHHCFFFSMRTVSGVFFPWILTILDSLKYGATITDQIKRLGASCDSSREHFTLGVGKLRTVFFLSMISYIFTLQAILCVGNSPYAFGLVLELCIHYDSFV
jgi:hypothetical protein